ncbi:MAG: DUF6263 family protein [Verrucomicrobiota bacterium]
METHQRSTNRVAGGSEQTTEDLTIGMTYALSVQAETATGGCNLLLEFIAYEMEIKMGDDVVISFDSANAAKSPNNPVPAPFRKLIGSNLHLETDSQGALARIVELPQWLEKNAGDGSGPASQMFLQQFNEGFFDQLLGFARGLPAEEVPVGASWPFKTDVPAGALGKIRVDTTIRFQRWDERDQSRFAVLNMTGSLQSAPAPGADASEGSVSLARGTVSSDSWFDPVLGALVESVVDQSMQLTGKTAASPSGDKPAADFTSDIEQKVTVKLAEVVQGGTAAKSGL